MLKVLSYITIAILLQATASYISARLNENYIKVALLANDLSPGLLYYVILGYLYGDIDKRETVSTILFILDL
jgi:hypothetical protein